MDRRALAIFVVPIWRGSCWMHQNDMVSHSIEWHIPQIDSGAQVIQVFDSWAGHLSPEDYDVFAAPYQVRPFAFCRALS